MDRVHIFHANVTDAVRTVAQRVIGGVVKAIEGLGKAVRALGEVAIEGGRSQTFANEVDHLAEVLAGQSTELLWHAVRVDVVE